VIHALHHEQDIWKMGGLRARLPVTARTFLLGTLALCGLPPLSGFYSKDAVLAAAQAKPVLFVLAVLVAALTAFYMARLYLVAFTGRARSGDAGHAQESPRTMTTPLRVLVVPAVFAGFLGLEALLGRTLGHEAHAPHAWHEVVLGPFNHSPLAAFLGLFATVFGLGLAWTLYRDAEADPLPAKLGRAARWMRDKFYFDELYAGLARATQGALAALADWLDRWVIAGLLVRGGHGTVELVGRALRLVQTGSLQTYAFLCAAGLALLLWLALARG
jgi:NADH-quinone oxidoreductase subunit L